MKTIVELLLCILHPIAVVLIWSDLLFRGELGLIAKLIWAVVSIVPFVPFVYVLTGNDFIYRGSAPARRDVMAGDRPGDSKT